MKLWPFLKVLSGKLGTDLVEDANAEGRSMAMISAAAIETSYMIIEIRKDRENGKQITSAKLKMMSCLTARFYAGTAIA